MPRNARLVLAALDRKEMDFLKSALNAQIEPKFTTRNMSAGKDLPKLTQMAIKLALRCSRGLGPQRQNEIRKQWLTRQQKHPPTHRDAWRTAIEKLKESLAKAKLHPGLLIAGLPPIGVPSKIPPVAICEPEQLIWWVVFRGTANRQLGRFVECEHCRKWGLRSRARKGMKYCGTKCQNMAHLEIIKRSQNAAAEFAAPGVSRRREVRLKQIQDRERKLKKKGQTLPVGLNQEKNILEQSRGR